VDFDRTHVTAPKSQLSYHLHQCPQEYRSSAHPCTQRRRFHELASGPREAAKANNRSNRFWTVLRATKSGTTDAASDSSRPLCMGWPLLLQRW